MIMIMTDRKVHTNKPIVSPLIFFHNYEKNLDSYWKQIFSNSTTDLEYVFPGNKFIKIL
jgi:flagellar assembly factor FliW